MGALRRRLSRLFAATSGGDALIGAPPPVPLREIFRRFWPYTRPYRRWFWLSLVFIVLAPASDTANIWLFKILVDDVLVPHQFGPFLWLAVAYVGLTLLDGVVSFADDYLSAWVGEHVLLDLRTSFFRHLHSLSLDFFEQRRLGDVISRLTGDVGAIEDLILNALASAVSYAARFLFFVGALFYLQWELALVSLVVAPGFWLVAQWFSGRIKQASRERRRRSGSLSAIAEESLANVALVQAYNRQETEVARFQREGVGAVAAQLAATRLRALFAPLIDLIELGGILSVIGVGTWELARGRISLGGLLVFIAYLSQLYRPIRGLSKLTTTFHSASASAERIIEFLEQRPAVSDPPVPLPRARARGYVLFDGVSFRYPTRSGPALQDVTFRVGPGETLALVGPSGAGKSTLVKLLLRLYDPTEGRIFLDGHDLRAYRLDDLRDSMAVLLQESLLFDGSIRDNIAYGRPGATEQEIVRAAVAADAHQFIAALPQGYDTVVGQKGRQLSGGQRQRVAIARAMLRDAPILILDEPTTGLDVETGQRILEPLRRLMRGRTTIVISHNLLTVREATSIVVLERGQVVERGTHQDLLCRGGAYARLYRLHHQEAEGAGSHAGAESEGDERKELLDGRPA